MKKVLIALIVAGLSLTACTEEKPAKAAVAATASQGLTWSPYVIDDQMTGKKLEFKTLNADDVTIMAGPTGQLVSVSKPSGNLNCTISCMVRVKVDGELRNVEFEAPALSQRMDVANPVNAAWIASAKQEVVIELPVAVGTSGRLQIVTFSK